MISFSYLKYVYGLIKSFLSFRHFWCARVFLVSKLYKYDFFPSTFPALYSLLRFLFIVVMKSGLRPSYEDSSSETMSNKSHKDLLPYLKLKIEFSLSLNWFESLDLSFLESVDFDRLDFSPLSQESAIIFKDIAEDGLASINELLGDQFRSITRVHLVENLLMWRKSKRSFPSSWRMMFACPNRVTVFGWLVNEVGRRYQHCGSNWVSTPYAPIIYGAV